MAKKQPERLNVTASGPSISARREKQTRDTLADHARGLIDHTIDNALAVGHGHMVGSQGPKGHSYVPSDAHLQSGGYIPQGVAKTPQNTATKNGCVGFDDPSQDDYGMVDTSDTEA